MSSSEQSRSDPASSWIVAIACFILTFVITGASRCNSLLFVQYLHQESEGGSYGKREVAAWPFAISGISLLFVAPSVGILSRWISAQKIALLGTLCYLLGNVICYFSTDFYSMVIFFGLLRGVGVTVIFSMVPAFINQHFRRHRATAQGIAGSGTSLGTVVFSFLIHHCLEKYALRGTLLLSGGIGLHAVVACQLLRDPPPESVRRVDAADSSKKEQRKRPHFFGTALLDMVRTLFSPYFILIVVTFMVVMNCGLLFCLVIVDHAQDLGLPDNHGIGILLAYSIGVFLGKWGLGWVVDRRLLTLRSYFVVSCSISGLIHLLLIPRLRSGAYLGAAAGLCGALQGSLLSTSTLFYAQHLTKERVPSAVSLHVALSGLVALSRPPIIGVFRDVGGSYDGLFQALGASLLVAVLIWIVEGIVVTRRIAITSSNNLIDAF